MLDCVATWSRDIRIESCDNETPSVVSVSRKAIADLKQGRKSLDMNSILIQVEVGVTEALTWLTNGQDNRIQHEYGRVLWPPGKVGGVVQ